MASQAYSVVINPMLTINTTLPNSTINLPYSQAVIVTGGTSPDMFAVTARSLPLGLSLNSATGAITGTPSTTTGSPFAFTITATDASGASAVRAYSFTINTAPTITTSTLSTAQALNPYSQTIAVSGGTAPVTYSISSGSLPAG